MNNFYDTLQNELKKKGSKNYLEKFKEIEVKYMNLGESNKKFMLEEKYNLLKQLEDKEVEDIIRNIIGFNINEFELVLYAICVKNLVTRDIILSRVENKSARELYNRAMLEENHKEIKDIIIANVTNDISKLTEIAIVNSFGTKKNDNYIKQEMDLMRYK